MYNEFHEILAVRLHPKNWSKISSGLNNMTYTIFTEISAFFDFWIVLMGSWPIACWCEDR